VGATAKQQQTHPKVMKKMVKKFSTGQSCIRKEVTSYKIHTLVWKQFLTRNQSYSEEIVKMPSVVSVRIL
jgi:hypothetical protein